MKIGPALIMIITVIVIIIAPAVAGAVIGMLIAPILSIDVTPAAFIGALGGFCASSAFLLNAGLNGEKGKGLR